MDQETWESINAIIQDEDISGIDSVKNLINADNSDACFGFYNSAINDTQRLIVAGIFNEHRTSDTRWLAYQFLGDVEDTSTNTSDIMHQVRAEAICIINGNYDKLDEWYKDIKTRKEAEVEALA